MTAFSFNSAQAMQALEVMISLSHVQGQARLNQMTATRTLSQGLNLL